MIKHNIKRGDILHADLNPVVGSEQGGIRPVLVIQNNYGNRYSPTIIIVPISCRVHSKTHLPTHVKLSKIKGLQNDSLILLEQIKTIDKERVQGYIGTLNDIDMARVNKALFVSLELNGKS